MNGAASGDGNHGRRDDGFDGAGFMSPQRLLLAVILALNLLLAAGVWLVAEDRRASELDKLRLTARSLVEVTREIVAGEYEKAEIALQAIADDHARYQALGAEEREAWLARTRARHPVLNFLRLTDATGEVIYAPGAGDAPRSNVSDRAYFKRLRDDRGAGLQVTEPVVGRTTGKTVVIFARRIDDARGAFAGVAIASVAVDHFHRQISRFPLGLHDSISLRDGEGRIVARRPHGPGADEAGSTSMSPGFRAALAVRPDAGFFESENGGADRIARIFAYLRDPKYGFLVSVGIARDQALAGWRDETRASVVVLLAFALGSMLMGLHLSRAWQRESAARASASERERRLIEVQRLGGIASFVYDIEEDRVGHAEEFDQLAGIDSSHPHTLAACLALVHPDDRAGFEHRLRQAIGGGQREFGGDFRIVRSDDGRVRHLTGRALLETGKGGRPRRVVGLLQDQTAAIESRAEMQASEARFRAFFDNAMIGMAVTSPEKGWIMANPALCQLLGLPREELLTRTWAQLTHPEDLAADVVQFDRVLSGEIDGYEIEKRFVRPDGRIVDTFIAARAVRRADASIDFFSAIVMDISRRKATEAALKRSLEVLAAAGTIARFGGWEVQLPSRALTWTDETYRIHDMVPGTPVTVEQALGFYTPESRPLIGAAVKEAIESGTPWDLDLELVTATGRLIWTRAFGHAEVVDGRTVRLYGAFLDISERKRSEQALKESKARYERAVNGANDGLWEWFPETGETYLSPRWKQLLGYQDHELPNTQNAFFDNVHPDDRSRVAEAIRAHFEDDAPYGIELRMRCNDGVYRWFFARGQVSRDDRGKPSSMAGSIADITERKNFERQLLESREMLRHFLDHLPGTAYVKDRDSRVLMANRGFLELIGLEPAEMIGRRSDELFPGEAGLRIVADDRRVLESGRTEVIEEEYAGRVYESTKFCIDQQGRRYLGGITLEVTSRARSRKRSDALLGLGRQSGLLDEREYLRFGLELAENITGSQIAFLHFVNDDQESIELKTWTTGALKGCQAAYDNHYPISAAGIWADCFRQKGPVVFNDYPGAENRRGLPEGHAALSRLISVPVIEEGQVRVMMGVGNKAVDYDDFDVQSVQLIGNDLWRVVRRMRLEQQIRSELEKSRVLNHKLEQAHNQLLQSEKMAAIGQLAAGVAHELNNPIGFIQSNIGSLETYVDDLLVVLDHGARCAAAHPDDQDAEMFRRVSEERDIDFIKSDIRQLMAESKDGTERVRRIVQNLKDFSHVSEEEWNWADLHQGLDSTLTLVWNEIKYKAEVEKRYGNLPAVHCMPSQINQVFMNLLVNAAQAIEARGRIIIASGSEGDRVWITISDNGKGIPPENLGRVFEPFFTTKPVGKGTGLGLSLAWGIVDKHHGALSVTSTVGVGTTFRVELPIDGMSVAAGER